MRKLVARLLAGLLLALPLATGAAVATPIAAGACGWYTEQSSVGSTSIWDAYYGTSTSVSFEVRTLNDGCGHKQYYSLVTVNDGDPVGVLTASIRVWVCGVAQGVWFSQSYNWYASVYSPVFYYGGCGRQADNYYSDAYSNSFSPADSSVYRTQN